MVEPRRSSRMQSTSKQVYVDSNGENDETPEPVAASSSRTKRQKASSVARKTNSKGKGKGKLRMLPEMPLDILFEIFGHVLPLDLLRLAWTSKALRSTLMRRSARSVWKQALSNAEGLPECPEDLTEPQWAHLAFYPYCHYCGAANVQTVAWACRVRSCGRCLKEHFVDVSGLKLPSNDEDEVVSQPALWVPGHLVTRRGHNELIFPVIEANKFIEEVMLLDTEELRAFLDKKKAELDEVYKHTADCYEWLENEREHRFVQRSEAKQRRWNAIYAKLSELGWEDELVKLLKWDPNCLFCHPLISQPRNLTNRTWNNIERPLVEFMEKKRVQRIQDEKVTVFMHREAMVADLMKPFVASHSRSVAWPGVADVCQMQEVKDIIECPIEVAVQSENFAAPFDQLLRLSEEWREKIGLRLLKLLPSLSEQRVQDTKEADLSLEPHRLDLATTYFQCKVCFMCIDYPMILFHTCMTSLNTDHRNYSLQGPDDSGDEMTQRFWALACEPWDYDGVKLEFDNDASEIAARLVDLCDLSPHTTTKKQIDELSPRFACKACNAGAKHTVMSWKVAIHHYMKKHHADFDSADIATSWILLSSRDAERARVMERSDWLPDALGDYDESHDPTRWKCSICSLPLALGPRELSRHMEGHGVEIERDEELRSHVYNDPDVYYEWPLSCRMRLTS